MSTTSMDLIKGGSGKMPHRPGNSDGPDVIHRVLTLLYTSHQSMFSKADLQRLGVSVQPFDIFNPEFLRDSQKCLFKPFDGDQLRQWVIPAHMAEWEGMKGRLNLPDVDPYSPLAQNPTLTEIHTGIKDVLAYLNTNFTFRTYGETRLCTELGWSVMDPRKVRSRSKDFLFSGHGSQVGAEFPAWQVWSIQVWREKNFAGIDFPTGPSIRMIISTDAIGPGDRMLLNELGAITEGIAFRRTQQEFQSYPILPVLVLSLFGRRNGRIIQACYDSRSGGLEIRVSEVLTFFNKMDPAFDIFLRFMASYPPESSSLDEALARMSISCPPQGLNLFGP